MGGEALKRSNVAVEWEDKRSVSLYSRGHVAGSVYGNLMGRSVSELDIC